jgi:hypothetical protein
MDARPKLDVSSAAARRRFYLDRAMRKSTRGSGSDLTYLMSLPRVLNGVERMIEPMFDTIPVFLIGAHAAAAYAPERMTKDIDYFVAGENYAEATTRIGNSGWTKIRDLHFPNAKLGLHGSAWRSDAGGAEVDLITSDQEWARAAFEAPVCRDKTGKRVIPLEFLVLMKLDSARANDQGDINRILGRLTSERIEDVVRVVIRYYDDPAAADDIRQSAEIGRWEYETP